MEFADILASCAFFSQVDGPTRTRLAPDVRPAVAQGDGRADGGALVLTLLNHAPRPTAIFCYNDMTAIGALAALNLHGVRVPADVSMVGFDDIPFAAYVDPPLTTISQPQDEMGRIAMTMLLGLIGKKHVENKIIKGELIVAQVIRTMSAIIKGEIGWTR